MGSRTETRCITNETTHLGYAKRIDLEKTPVTYSRLYSDVAELGAVTLGAFVAQNETDGPDLAGRSTYQDASGRVVYYNSFLKKSFYIPHDRQRAYTNLAGRHMIAIALGCIVWGVLKNVPIGLVVGIGSFMALQAYFYLSFLTSLELAPNDDSRRQAARRTNPFATMSRQQSIRMSAIMLVLGALIALNACQQQFVGILLYVNFALAAASMAFGIMCVIALLRGETK